jgi:hypothetical protein
MRSSEWLDRPTANADVATFLGSISASSDTAESDKALLKIVPLKEEKNVIVILVGRGRGVRPELNPRMPYRNIETNVLYNIFVTLRILDY